MFFRYYFYLVYKTQWDKLKESKNALDEVEKKTSIELNSQNIAPEIEIKKIEPNAFMRTTIYYTKDGKNKRLYFSKEEGSWRINYSASRLVAQSYFALMKNWIISILPTFK